MCTFNLYLLIRAQTVHVRDHGKRGIIRLPDEETEFISMVSSRNVHSDSESESEILWRLRLRLWLRLLPKLLTLTDSDFDSAALVIRVQC